MISWPVNICYIERLPQLTSTSTAPASYHYLNLLSDLPLYHTFRTRRFAFWSFYYRLRSLHRRHGIASAFYHPCRLIPLFALLALLYWLLALQFGVFERLGGDLGASKGIFGSWILDSGKALVAFQGIVWWSRSGFCESCWAHLGYGWDLHHVSDDLEE